MVNASNFIHKTPELNWQCRQFCQNLLGAQGCENSRLLDLVDGIQMFSRFFVVFGLSFGNDGLAVTMAARGEFLSQLSLVGGF
jgi:hypothetical protein